MKSRMQYIRKKIISTIFLLLIGGIIFNSTFFLHTHRTACGNVIVHAHPFNKSAENKNPYSQHKHNKIELQVIRSLSYFVNFESSIAIVYNPVFETEILSKPCLYFNLKIHSSYTNRGPPSISFLA